MVEVAYNIAVTVIYMCVSVIVAAFTTVVVACFAYGTLRAIKDNAKDKED
jgi:hypothetical protein